MKKLLFTLFAAMLTLNVAAQATSGKCGDLTWNLEGGTLTFSGNGKMQDYDNIWERPWLTKASDRGKIENLVLNEGITYIGEYAFQECYSITNVILPNSLVEIGKHAFQNCEELTISSENTNIDIKEAAFDGCTKMTENGSIYFSNVLVRNRESKEINLKESTTKIAPGAFRGNKYLESIYFGANDKLTTIGDEAFSGCTNLVTCNIPKSVTNWGTEIFSGCENLKNAEILITAEIENDDYYTVKEEVRYIEKNAFNHLDCSLNYLIYEPSNAPALGGSLFERESSFKVETTIIPSGATNYTGAHGPSQNLTQIKNLNDSKYTSCTFLHNAIVPKNVAVYYAKVEDDQVVFTKVNDETKDDNFYIEKGVGVFLKTTDTSTNTVYEFKDAGANVTDTKEVNSLIGVTKNMTLTSDDNAWVMQTKNKVQGFYRVGTNGINIKIGKAYLEYANSNARVLSIFDESATAIEEIDEDYASNNATIYNVNGQKMTAPQKGVNIINGKIIIK